jgi:dTDP-glucose 4,6-dehydratase
VEDVCRALELLLERGRIGEVYNVGSGTECSNLDMARMVARLLGSPQAAIEHVADRPGHDRRYAVDDTKLRALGWRPARSFEETLGETVAWYREHETWWDRSAQPIHEDLAHRLNGTVGASAHPAIV